MLALRCVDGIVLGSDSQITDSARGLSYPAQKLHPFGETAAWGGSGSRAVLFDLEQLFDSCAAAVLDAENIGHAVQERVVPVLRRHYDQFVEPEPREPRLAIRELVAAMAGPSCRQSRRGLASAAPAAGSRRICLLPEPPALPRHLR